MTTVNICSTFVNPEDGGHGSEKQCDESGHTDESPTSDHSEMLSSSLSETGEDRDSTGFEGDPTPDEPTATQEDTQEPSERVEPVEAEGPEGGEGETEAFEEATCDEAPLEAEDDGEGAPGESDAGSGRSREGGVGNLDQFQMFTNLPEERQKAIKIIYYVAQRRRGAALDLDDIAERVCGDAVAEWPWVQAVVNCAIILAAGTSAGIKEVAQKLGLEPDLVELIGSFVKMQLCNPIGTGLWEWAKANLWKSPPEVLLELVGCEEEDLWYILEGREVPSREKVKGMDDELLEFATSTVLGLRSIRDRIRSYLHTKEALLLYLLSVNKLTIVLNEIRDEIRIQIDNAKERQSSERSVSLSDELLEQFRPFVEMVAAEKSKGIPGVSRDELEQDLWIGVITGILGWEPERSSLETWVKKMVFWKVQEVRKLEFERRRQHRENGQVNAN